MFTINSIVVKVKEGLISELVWDNACYDCENKCEKNITSRSELNNTHTMFYENCYENNSYYYLIYFEQKLIKKTKEKVNGIFRL